MSTTKPKPKLRILFATDPDSPDLRFVEVENEGGFSISVGEWATEGEYRVLTIPDDRGGGLPN